MGKIAFVFSGQGAQKAGMGLDFYEKRKTVHALFDKAEEQRPETLEMCFHGTDELLKKTENTQPCLYLADLAAAITLKELGITPDAVAGFSLGELPALAFAGAYTPLDGFRLAGIRGKAMGEAAEKHPASMFAVMKPEKEKVEELCKSFKQVYPVNDNAPGQLVVAGAAEEMDDFKKALKEAGGRGMPVAVGGGFHSPFMEEAAEQFRKNSESVPMQKPEIPVYSNFTTKPYGEDVRGLMTSQIHNSLRWQESIKNMAAEGFDTFIEVGVGSTLKKLIKRILPESRTYSVSSVEEAMETAKEVG